MNHVLILVHSPVDSSDVFSPRFCGGCGNDILDDNICTPLCNIGILMVQGVDNLDNSRIIYPI